MLLCWFFFFFLKDSETNVFLLAPSVYDILVSRYVLGNSFNENNKTKI